MPLFKKGTCSSSVIIASSVYACTSCDHTEMVKDDNSGNKTCPKCHSDMRMISSQASEIDKS